MMPCLRGAGYALCERYGCTHLPYSRCDADTLPGSDNPGLRFPNQDIIKLDIPHNGLSDFIPVAHPVHQGAVWGEGRLWRTQSKSLIFKQGGC